MSKAPVYFNIFADCKIVHGSHSSLLYDLNRSQFFPIDKEYAEVLATCDGQPLSSVMDKYSIGVKAFLDKFIAKDLAFYNTSPDVFPALSTEFTYPSQIISAVLEIGSTQEYDILNVLDQLDELGCKKILLCISPDADTTHRLITEIFDRLVDSFVVGIELVIPYSYVKYFNEQFYLDHLRVSRVLYYEAPSDDVDITTSFARVLYTTDRYNDIEEKISPDIFHINATMYNEALGHNVGLNRKMAISKEGSIKNFLSHEQTFGHVNTDELQSVVVTEKFQKKWFLYNDRIFKCRDCKYRYCCLSNSDIYEEEGTYYKRNYCGYDPVLDTWDGSAVEV